MLRWVLSTWCTCLHVKGKAKIQEGYATDNADRVIDDIMHAIWIPRIDANHDRYVLATSHVVSARRKKKRRYTKLEGKTLTYALTELPLNEAPQAP